MIKLPTLSQLKTTTSKVNLVFAVLAGTLVSMQAQAVVTPLFEKEEGEKYGVQVGVNVQYAENGYDMDDESVKILPGLFYDNGIVYARGNQIGGYLINSDKNEFTAFLQPDGARFESEDAVEALQELDDRKWSGMLGLSYMYKSSIGGFRGRVSTDVFNESDGTVAQLAYLARLNPGKWTIYPSAGIEWVDDNYNDYYYGVSEKESIDSGVSAYDPDASFNPYVSVSATYDFNDDWSLFLSQNVSYLADEQDDSPMVDNRTAYRSTIGLLYEF